MIKTGTHLHGWVAGYARAYLAYLVDPPLATAGYELSFSSLGAYQKMFI
jgi:hypothetical protein